MNRYEINNKTYTYPTQVLGQLSKGDALIQWAADMTIDYIKENDIIQYKEEKQKDLTINKYWLNQDQLENARYAWKNYRNVTADLGTQLHNLVESFINIRFKKLEDQHNIKYMDISSEIEYLRYIYTLDTNLKQMFYQFYIWQRDNVKQFIASEQTIVHEDLCYAGTLDFIYIDNEDKIVCCDLKTSNNIYKEHEIQVCAYKTARESMEGKYEIIMHGNKNNKKIRHKSLSPDRRK